MYLHTQVAESMGSWSVTRWIPLSSASGRGTGWGKNKNKNKEAKRVRETGSRGYSTNRGNWLSGYWVGGGREKIEWKRVAPLQIHKSLCRATLKAPNGNPAVQDFSSPWSCLASPCLSFDTAVVIWEKTEQNQVTNPRHQSNRTNGAILCSPTRRLCDATRSLGDN